MRNMESASFQNMDPKNVASMCNSLVILLRTSDSQVEVKVIPVNALKQINVMLERKFTSTLDHDH